VLHGTIAVAYIPVAKDVVVFVHVIGRRAVIFLFWLLAPMAASTGLSRLLFVLALRLGSLLVVSRLLSVIWLWAFSSPMTELFAVCTWSLELLLREGRIHVS
jgi:hypothetical protein